MTAVMNARAVTLSGGFTAVYDPQHPQVKRDANSGEWRPTGRHTPAVLFVHAKSPAPAARVLPAPGGLWRVWVNEKSVLKNAVYGVLSKLFIEPQAFDLGLDEPASIADTIPQGMDRERPKVTRRAKGAK
jgi:hypothetical protein